MVAWLPFYNLIQMMSHEIKKPDKLAKSRVSAPLQHSVEPIAAKRTSPPTSILKRNKSV